ncbi:MAG: hypothetical protein ACOY81_10380 [Bacillota bacterium]
MFIYTQVLDDFVAGIIPAMVQRGYHSRPAKTAAWGEGHIDQPLLVHIQNGVFGLLQVLALLEKEGIRLVDEAGLRRAIAMYVTHDLHKMAEYAVPQDAGRSQFDQALEDYQAEIQALGLDKFADTVPAMHRAAAVSLCSPKTGDLSACPPGTALLVDLVHLADCMASMTHCQQTSVLANRLQKLLPPGRAHRSGLALAGRFFCCGTLGLQHAGGYAFKPPGKNLPAGLAKYAYNTAAAGTGGAGAGSAQRSGRLPGRALVFLLGQSAEGTNWRNAPVTLC